MMKKKNLFFVSLVLCIMFLCEDIIYVDAISDELKNYDRHSSAEIITDVNSTYSINDNNYPFQLSCFEINEDIILQVKTNTCLSVEIYELKQDNKKAVYQGMVNDLYNISNIQLDELYKINIYNEYTLYTGTFKAYIKDTNKNKIFVGLDMNMISRSNEYEEDGEPTRQVTSNNMNNTYVEKEYNNNFKQANKLFTTNVQGKISYIFDADFYKTMFYKEDVVILLEQIPENKDYDIYIYNNDQELIASSEGDSLIESITLKDIIINQWYYIKVVGYGLSCSSKQNYLLSILEVQKENVEGSSFETAKVATVLKPYEGTFINREDKNYYKFTPAEDGIFDIYTSGIIDTVGTLYTKDKEEIISNDDKPNDEYGNFLITTELKANIQYFIEVKTYSTGTGDYSLYIQKIKEQNNEENEKIKENKEYTISFNSTNKMYMYEFIPEETNSYSIEFSNNDNIVCTLYNGLEEKINEGRKIDNTNRVEMAQTLLNGEKYYIRVESFNDSVESEAIMCVQQLKKPNDEHFDQQWGLLNVDNGIDINVLPSWKYLSDNNINIAIADTGVYYNHEDLKNTLDMDLAYNFVHDRKDIYPETEKYSMSSAKAGHGTHVAGTIAGESNNGLGITGIMPGHKVIPLKVLGSRLTDSTDYVGSIKAFVKAVDYAKENNIKVINCSFGGAEPSEAEKEAIVNAPDILFVIAAGNSGNDLSQFPEYPACYYANNSLVVGALAQDGQLAEYSNYGGPTDIAAPGNIIYTTTPEDSYIEDSGTSMAAPSVTAVAGMVWGNNIDLTPIEIKGIIINDNNVTKLKTLENKVNSNGIVNVYKAVTSKVVEVTRYDNSNVERQIRSYINDKNKVIDNNKKTNQIIFKLQNNDDYNDCLDKLKKENVCGEFQVTDYLNLIDAYVLQFEGVEEAENAVNLLNSFSQVDYAEINYIREVY